MDTDEALQAEIMDRLNTIPEINPTELLVAVNDGIVTLAGDVKSHQARFHVERAVRRAPGVQGISSRLTPSRPILHLPHRIAA